jgi:uroporphyrinogen decarboxylase
MSEMTSYERIKRMFEHKEADRIPVFDEPWHSTIERWQKEGMPEKMSYVDYFGLDKIVGIGVDSSPRYPERIIEETEDYVIKTTSWGVTLKNWKHSGGVPEFLDFTIKDPDSWIKAKERIVPSKDRINWDNLKQNYKKWKKDGAWIRAGFWFGFDVTHSWMVGTERVLIALVENPEWMIDMFNYELDTCIALFEMVWDAGYKFDQIIWWDDMGYKHNQFFSLDMYRRILKPVHKRACDWAHKKGIYVEIHSCGDVNPFVPELIEIGVDMLNPVEVKAGMDPIGLKNKYGNRLSFRGGLNAVLFNDMEKMYEEVRKIIPVMKKNGGYIASSDHSVPDSVSLKDFKKFVEMIKGLGKY